MNEHSDNYEIQVIGHQWAIDLLSRQQAEGHVPQSLLLTGLPNVGKATLARYVAQMLNCQESAKPCGQCRSCRKIISGNHPDVRIFDDDQSLKIDQIRELLRELSLSPHESQYRVAVLCDFERTTTSAANALLKTLEEPAESVVIMLTATEPGKLLPTIVSRCQMLALRSLSRPTIFEALQTRWDASPEQAELLAQLAAGRLGWAVRALQDQEFLARREHHLGEMMELLRLSRAERLTYAQQRGRDPAAIKDLLALWLTVWRDLLLLCSGSQAMIINLDWQEKLSSLARRISLAQARDMVSGLRTALINLDYNVNPRLNLEIVLLKLPMHVD